MKIAIAGYYGYNNFGDEINLLQMIKLINAQYPKAQIDVFSRSLWHTFIKPKYHLIPAAGIPMTKFRKMLNGYDLLIIGGGGLLYLGTHFLTYLDEGITVPYIISRVGIDDRAVNADAVERIKHVIERARHICVRTRGDKGLLKKHMGINCDVVPEAIWNYRAPSYSLPSSRRKIIVSLNVYASRLAGTIRRALSQISNPAFAYILSMQDTTIDCYYNVCATGPKNRRVIPDSIGLDGKGGCLASADLTITSRLHAALVSISHGVPALMLESTPKLKFLAEEIGLSCWHVNREGIRPCVIDKMLAEKERERLRLNEITEKMREKASAQIVV